jgi:ATP/maltotriose-dependent transcriptional regulator MalT
MGVDMGNEDTEEKADALREQIKRLRSELSRLPTRPIKKVRLNYIIGKSYELLFFRVYDRFGHTLSVRELETVTLLFLGNQNSKIAKEMFIQEKSVKFHLTRIYAKLGVKNRVECIFKVAAALNVPAALPPKKNILSDE